MTEQHYFEKFKSNINNFANSDTTLINLEEANKKINEIIQHQKDELKFIVDVLDNENENDPIGKLSEESIANKIHRRAKNSRPLQSQFGLENTLTVYEVSAESNLPETFVWQPNLPEQEVITKEKFVAISNNLIIQQNIRLAVVTSLLDISNEHKTTIANKVHRLISKVGTQTPINDKSLDFC